MTEEKGAEMKGKIEGLKTHAGDLDYRIGALD
jgi:hypothetical protein